MLFLQTRALLHWATRFGLREEDFDGVWALAAGVEVNAFVLRCIGDLENRE